MADGTPQAGFAFPKRLPTSLLRADEIVVDLFAGGGGASEALEQALGRPVDIAINHDTFAIGMHAANHPFTHHLQDDVWHANPVRLVAGRPLGWFHASPDCTHFSQARGGQPRSRATRALSWCVVKWVGMLARVGCAPRILSLENVEQILKWGPLVAKRVDGRVLTLDRIPDPSPSAKPGDWVYRVAERGERVPVERQQLVPDKRHLGRTWDQFVAVLRSYGYTVEWRKLRADWYGAGTSRERLFLLARRDGEPIRWPAPTHGAAPLLPLVTAADCIDWTLPCPSIFTRKKPLADATLRRIARGVKRYVLDAADPFIVPDPPRVPNRDVSAGAKACPTGAAAGLRSTPVGEPQPLGAHHETADLSRIGSEEGSHPASSASVAAGKSVAPFVTEHANATNQRSWRADEPLRTQCANVKGGHFALAAATLVQTGYGERAGQAPRVPGLDKPLGTLVDGQKHAAVMAFLEQAAGGPNSNPSRNRGADEPVSTISTKGSQQRLVTASLATLRGDNTGAAATDPLRTISAGGEHHAVVECTLSPEQEAGALRVAAFMVNYYGNGQPLDPREPIDTITTRDRMALVTVSIRGTPYVIVDIGLRMLRREELFRAQGFPPDYVIDRTGDGRTLTVSQSVRMVGNSVSPPPLRALAQANLDPAEEPLRMAA